MDLHGDDRALFIVDFRETVKRLSKAIAQNSWVH